MNGAGMVYSLRALYGARQKSPSCVWYYIGKVGEWRDLYFYYWLIQGNGQIVLVDTGVPLNKPEDFDILNRSHQYVHEDCIHPPEHVVQPQDALAAVGLAPTDVHKILITSTSSYATGNIELFTNADVYVSRLGWENVTGGDRMGLYEQRVFFPAATMAYLQGPGKSRLHLVDDEELLPGLRFWWTGVHHRGSMAVSVQTSRGKVNFADAAFVYENLEEKRPIGCIESMAEWNEVYPRLMDADLVLPFHDYRLLERYPDGISA
jgi:glyoxylase-like metal-dependent hydrolase (beta-lactamase superfamily II)